MFPTDQILQGDSTRVLRTLPDASVDLVCEDRSGKPKSQIFSNEG